MLGDHQEINVDSADTFSNLDITILSAFSHNPVAYLYDAVIPPVALNLFSSFSFVNAIINFPLDRRQLDTFKPYLLCNLLSCRFVMIKTDLKKKINC